MAKRKGSLVAVVGLILVGVILVVAGIATALALWLPTSGVSTELQTALSERLGRHVVIGKVNLTLWPVLGLQAQQATIGNIAGGHAANLVEAEAIDIGVSPIPLLSGRVEVRNIVLQNPTVRLEKLKDGRINWDLQASTKAAPTHQPSWLKSLQINKFEIDRGLLSYSDDLTGKTQTLADLSLSLALRSLDDPLNATGHFTWAGQKSTFAIGIVKPRSLMAGQETPATVSLTSAPLNLKLNGTVAPEPGAIAGDIDASGPSLRNLARLVGSPMDPGPGLQAFSVKGHVVRQGQLLKLEQSHLGLDHLTADGDLSIDLSHPRPLVSGKLSTGSLNMNPYLGPEPPPGAAWTTTPIRLDGLKAFDADLAISAARVTFRKYQIANAALTAAVKAGQADIHIQRMSLYGGAGSGRVVAAATPGGGRFGFSFQMTGVQVKSLLMDAVKVNRLEGAAGVNLNLTASGGNQSQLMHSLAGKASLTVNNGVLTGVDLAAVSRQITSAMTGGAVGDTARTAFSVAGADFILSQGVATTTDLKLSGPGVAVSGVGKIDIGDQSLDMSIKPQGAAKVAGRKIDLGAVPFRVFGPWVKPQYEADLKGVAEGALRGQLGKLIGGDKGGVDLDSILGGLTGQSPKTPPGTPAPGATPADATKTEPTSTPPKEKAPKLKDLISGLIPH